MWLDDYCALAFCRFLNYNPKKCVLEGDSMPNRYYQVVIEQDEDGFFVAEVPGIRACYTQGKTFEEVMENIKDVIQMCLEEMKSRGEELPEQREIIWIKRIEVAV